MLAREPDAREGRGTYALHIGMSSRRAGQNCNIKGDKLPDGQITFTNPPVSSHRRAARDRHGRGAGCGGRGGGARRARPAADGEVVWSWRPDAGVKVAEISADDGGKKARSPVGHRGEHEISR